MKILWVKTDFLHPTNRGGQIRTLETLRRLHRRHEVHYAALDEGNPEGVRRSSEYCTRAYPVKHKAPGKRSPGFLWQISKGLFSPVPVAVSRFHSPDLERLVARVIREEKFDSVVCDFLASTPNVPSLEACLLFQHNVETMIWRRRAENASNPVSGPYLHLQARRMFEYERKVCRSASHVIAVSENDARLMRDMFGIGCVSVVPTGVDTEYFACPAASPQATDIVFVGSMDWVPNVDGVLYFVQEVLPLIRRQRPACKLAIVGRSPSREILALAREDSGIQVTGTVPDVRPWLWGAALSVVPLRIGGGTRLKIYEAMAAGTPVVSTSIGAEGLEVNAPQDIRIADDENAFAEQCLELLENRVTRAQVGDAGRHLVNSRFSWDRVVDAFERILEEARTPAVHR